MTLKEYFQLGLKRDCQAVAERAIGPLRFFP